MKIKNLLILALIAMVAVFSSCATTQQKDKDQEAEEMEADFEFDEEFDGEEYGTEASEDEEFPEEGGEIVLDGDPEDASKIVISKESMTLNLYDSKGGLIYSFPVAVGKALGNKEKIGDNKTPEGEFSIQQIQSASSWEHDFGDGKGSIKGAYGNWFIRLKTPPHTGIGIHGTHDPNSIGTRASEGCIRLNNADLDKLKPLVKVGMPVIIETSIADQEADGKRSDDGVNQETIDDVAEDDFFEDVKKNEQKAFGEIKEDEIPVVEHVIESGDTFGALAVKYETTTARIKELNPDVDPTKLQLGQKIRVKGAKPATKQEKQEKQEAAKPEQSKPAANSGDAVYHTIESGDTYGNIAPKYNTSRFEIEKLNPDVDPTKLQIGQKIRVK